MKKITSILLAVIVFTMAFSTIVFAAEKANVLTITTDVDSVKAGESVIVDVEMTGDFTDLAMIQLGVKYDTDKFSTVTSGRAPWGFDSTWYNSTKDGNAANLGYINTPSFGENPVGQINVMWISTDGYYIDNGGALYGDNKTTTAAKIKFTAKADVDVIDAACFELTNVRIQNNNGVDHTFTLNQIEAAEPEKVPTDEKVADLEANTAPIVSEDGKTQYTGVAVFTADFSLADYANVEDYGVKFADKKESLKGVTGNGTLSWVFAFYGIGEGETPAVETFKTILK